MTITGTKEGKIDEAEIVVNAEPLAEPLLETAVGVQEVAKPTSAGGKSNEPPVPAGHARYYCEKCRLVSVACCVKWLHYRLLKNYDRVAQKNIFVSSRVLCVIFSVEDKLCI